MFDKDMLVSIVSCFIVGDEMQFRKLATLEDYQGKGIATVLLHYILKLAKDKGLGKVWCNARTNKKSFYEKFEIPVFTSRAEASKSESPARYL